MGTLTDRQEQILLQLVEDYITSGAPVASGLLAERHPEGISPATVRSEMARLGEQGYIHQPHTSAGRMPTERAYQWYVAYARKHPARPSVQERNQLAEAFDAGGERRAQMKHVGRALAECAREAVYIAFDSDDVYYTGITYLLEKPEMNVRLHSVDIGAMLDHLAEAVDALWRHSNAEDSFHVALGSRSPFGSSCATLWFYTDQPRHLVGLLGPLRMPYRAHMARMEYLHTLIA